MGRRAEGRYNPSLEWACPRHSRLDFIGVQNQHKLRSGVHNGAVLKFSLEQHIECPPESRSGGESVSRLLPAPRDR